MLNKNVVYELLAAAGKTDTEFFDNVFGKNAKRGRAYFDNLERVTFAQAEKIADFFHVPLDSLREHPNFSIVPNGEGASINNDLAYENARLRKDIDGKKLLIASKEETIKMANQLLATKDAEIKRLTELINNQSAQ
ncbi:MAG: hypothetical protein KBT34_01535 [Prevotella sp.]|nr:hypothetical protein [Candidatus Prevotella equi]